MLVYQSDLTGTSADYGGDSVEVVNGTVTTMQIAVDLDNIVVPAFTPNFKINLDGAIFFNNIVPMET